MKNKLTILILSWMLVMASLTGCGDEASPETESESMSVSEDTNVTEETASEEPSPSPAVPTPEPATPEPSVPETPTPEPVVVTDEWAVNLYNAVVADDFETTIRFLEDVSGLREKCEPYPDTKWPVFEGETAYAMPMSDGETLGVLFFDSEDSWLEVRAFVTYQDGQVGYGDHCIILYSDGTHSYIKDGKEVISTHFSQGSFSLEDSPYWW